jgi:hypothetical protein
LKHLTVGYRFGVTPAASDGRSQSQALRITRKAQALRITRKAQALRITRKAKVPVLPRTSVRPHKPWSD